MRRSRKDKELTRKLILDIAARKFREKGFDGISVADLMAEAGLTHGGFYKHFSSRDDLIVEALKHMIKESGKSLRDGMEETQGEGIEAFLNRYLANRHLSDPGKACPVATLATEVAQNPVAQETFESFFDRYSSWIATMLGDIDMDDEQKKLQAASIICSAAGTYAVARTMSDKKQAQALMDTTKKMLLDSLQKQG